MAFYACTFTHCSVNYFAVGRESLKAVLQKRTEKASLPKIGRELLKYFSRASMTKGKFDLQNLQEYSSGPNFKDFLLFGARTRLTPRSLTFCCLTERLNLFPNFPSFCYSKV